MRIDIKKYNERRKWAMLRKYILGINPPGFHNWYIEEYTEHIQYLDDLIEGY